MHDTIIALATPQGSGAIGIVRISGSKAIEITDKIFEGKKNLQDVVSQKIVFGTIQQGDHIVDEVLVSVFRNPHSYTGEDTVEISCHGSSFIVKTILELLLKNGAKLAKAGEFTQRAFLNGKLDLTQAEAVADLIASETRASHQIAMNQMRGGISNELSELRDQLIHFTALIELELDFGEEDVQFADRAQLQQLIDTIKSKIQKLITSFDYGNAIKNGVPVAIVGPPNAGKSSLLNQLLNEDRAIVSAIAGTTRDTIEEEFTIDGIVFRLIDTAGIRESKDTIETIGIERTMQTIQKAKIVLNVFDGSTSIPLALHIENKDIVVLNLANKIDLVDNMSFGKNIFPISALKNKGIDTLKEQLVASIRGTIAQNDVIVSNARHYEALQGALTAIGEVQNALAANISGDLLSPHLREALGYIGNITGDIDIDKDILGTIFGKFCIGK